MRVGARRLIRTRTDPACSAPQKPEEDEAAEPTIADVYRNERPRLLRLLRRRTTIEEAQDIVQQVFCRLLGKSRAEAPMRSPDAYLHRAVVNHRRDRGRADQRRSAALHISGDAVDELAAPDQTAALEARDMLRRIEAAIGSLKPKTREIFLAHRIDGYSYAEIAARTGLSIKAVEKQMSNAIAHLDRILGPL